MVLVLIYHAVVVGWFFTSMSLMEGKGLSGVVDVLSTVRPFSLKYPAHNEYALL